MNLSTKERIRTVQEMQWADETRFEISTRIAEEAEDRYGLDLFVPRTWSPIQIDATVWGETLPDFSARVAKVAKVFGPPKKVHDENYCPTPDGPPDIVAVWEVPLSKFPKTAAFARKTSLPNLGKMRIASELFAVVTLQVRAMRPEGCKVDPTTPYVAEQRPRLHPECRAVLRTLEYLGAEVAE